MLFLKQKTIWRVVVIYICSYNDPFRCEIGCARQACYTVYREVDDAEGIVENSKAAYPR